MMADELSQQVDSLLSVLFTSADERGQIAAERFAACFAEDGKFTAGAAGLEGRQGKASTFNYIPVP